MNDKKNKKTEKHVALMRKKLSFLNSPIKLTVTVQPVFESVYRAAIDDVCW